MAFLTDLAFDFATIVATTVKGAANAVLANLEVRDVPDALGGGVEASTEEPMYGVPGFYVRPMPPVAQADATGLAPEGEAEAFVYRHGDQVVPIAGRDLRLNAQVNPSVGSVGMAHYGGGFLELGWNASKNGTLATLYVLRKTSSGAPDKASAIFMDSEQDNASIVLLHEYGHSVVLNKDGSAMLLNKAGDAFVEVNDDGVTINGASVAITGAAHIGASDPASTDFLALGTDLLSWVGQVNTFIADTKTLLETTGLPVAGGGGGTAKAASTPAAPTAVPRAATKAKGV